MHKKIVTLSLVLVVALSFTACGKAVLPSAQEIVDGVIESFDNIRTYQFDIVSTVGTSGEAEGDISFAVLFDAGIGLSHDVVAGRRGAG